MNVQKAIEHRRAIRKWQNKQVNKKTIKEILNAARMAPSAKNTQSHRYLILNRKEIKKLESHNVFKQPYLYNAPSIMVCCADPKQYPKSTDVDETPEKYAYIDLSIAAAFMTLRATELGLGSVFVAWIYRNKLKQALGIPMDYLVPFVIPFGYPAEDPKPKPRKKLSELIIFPSRSDSFNKR
jgi:nitroreductase